MIEMHHIGEVTRKLKEVAKVVVFITLYIIGGMISGTIVSVYGIRKNWNNIDVEYLAGMSFLASWFSCVILIGLLLMNLPYFIVRKMLKK